jgi:CheY-like chemotaxis protein
MFLSLQAKRASDIVFREYIINRGRRLKRILIAASLQTFIEDEKNILNRRGCKIVAAVSGEEILNMHKAEKADLIVVDLDMPGISGDKLCSIIKKDKRTGQTSLILVCSKNKSEIDRCSNSKADFCITRPVAAPVLLKKIRELLNIQKRESVRIPLQITAVGSYSYKTFFCHAVDISSSGMLIETDKILHKGKSVSCLVSMPASRQITVHGKVARVRIKSPEIFQYGINFIHLDADAMHAIKAFINR